MSAEFVPILFSSVGVSSGIADQRDVGQDRATNWGGEMGDTTTRDLTHFRRFTNLAGTIHMLQTQQITLLTPDTWDDRNDRHFMKVYKDRKGLRTLTAICLSQGPETYHHWKVFSPGSDGVCILFHRDKLLRSFEDNPRIRHRHVDYYEIARLPDLQPAVNELPFIKRYPYEPESEYRVLYEDTAAESEFTNFALVPGSIDAIILSPWMPATLVESVKTTLKKIRGASRIRIYSSTLISNAEWQAVADRS